MKPLKLTGREYRDNESGKFLKEIQGKAVRGTRKFVTMRGDVISRAEDEITLIEGIEDMSVKDQEKTDEIIEKKDEETKKDEDSKSDDEDDDKVKKEDKEEVSVEETVVFSLKDELGGLLASEGLSEEFKTKAITVFESAVNDASKSFIDEATKELSGKMDEAIEAKEQKLQEEADAYITLTAKNWIKENEDKYRTGIKAKTAISFMEKMTELFTDHYIDLDESEVSLVEAKLTESDEHTEMVKGKLTEAVETIKELGKEIEVMKFTSAFSEMKAEKIKSLAEDIDFEGSDEFVMKLEILESNYFSGKETLVVKNIDDVTNDNTGVIEEEKEVTGNMGRYVNSLSTLK